MARCRRLGKIAHRRRSPARASTARRCASRIKPVVMLMRLWRDPRDGSAKRQSSASADCDLTFGCKCRWINSWGLRRHGVDMPTIVAIQALRAVAAIAVALCHFSQVSLILHGHTNDPIPGFQLGAGVDLFFVISGFIMVYSSEPLFAAS